MSLSRQALCPHPGCLCACALADGNFRVGFFESVVEKSDVPYNSELIGQYPRFQRVTEMTMIYCSFTTGFAAAQSGNKP